MGSLFDKVLALFRRAAPRNERHIQALHKEIQELKSAYSRLQGQHALCADRINELKERLPPEERGWTRANSQ